MATQAATFTTAQAQALRQNLPEFLSRLQVGNPDNQLPAVTITTDTAGTITFALAAHQGNAAYSKAITASVAQMASRKKHYASFVKKHGAKPNAKAPLGQGGRFAALKNELAGKGARDPGALAAFIGRKKYGDKKFDSLSRHGKQMAKRTGMYATFVKRAIGKRLPPPDVQRASSVGPDGKSTRTVNDDAMPRYKPKKGYKDAPGGTRYGGNYLYDKNTGRRKV